MLSPRSRPKGVWLSLLVALSMSAACDGATGPISEPEPEPPVPVVLACAAPAPLDGTPDWSDPRFIGFIVTYHDGIDPAAETARLSERYGFTPLFVYRYALLGFAAALTPDALNGIRCETTVRRVAADWWVKVIPAASAARNHDVSHYRWVRRLPRPDDGAYRSPLAKRTPLVILGI